MAMGLGDLVEKALSSVGITQERAKKWLGEECGCEDRKQKLNALSNWAYRIVTGKTEKAEEYFNQITSED